MEVEPAGEDIKNTWCTASYVTVSTVWSYTIIIYIIFLHYCLNNIEIISKYFHRKSYKEQVIFCYVRQPIAVSDISVYICLIWYLRSKSKERLNERQTCLSIFCLKTSLEWFETKVVPNHSLCSPVIIYIIHIHIMTWCQILCTMRLQCVAFRICMTCYRWKSTVLPGKLFFFQKNAQKQAFFEDTIPGSPDFGRSCMPNYWD